MTSALMCDGCGRVVSTRADDAIEATRSWWRLERDPGIESGLLQPIQMDLTVDDEVAVEPRELEELPPPLHFCSDACLRSWTEALAIPTP